MLSSLTDEQENIIKAAEEGHNLFISGKAGTGKSFVVSHILKSLRRLGREVVVVCASGISCSVFDDVAKTVHSHYALQTADMPADMVISRAASLPHCVHRICAADTIVWDEVGMSSQRVFEIVNAIHHEVSKGDDQWKPFGGKQVILVGEFLQLKPVPNTFDNGEFIFRSVLFRIAFGHRFELTRLMRQDTASAEFTKALSELRLGVCSDDSTHVLRSLSRPISHESPVHIYFKKLSVQMHNSEVLFRMPGQLFSYECIDEGNVQGINCPADSKVLMKPNAKVMIVWNLSDKIKNGTAGIFLGVRDDLLEVQVASEQKTVYLKRQTWSKRNRTGQIVGSRTQYPVTLFYASTCHKTQGLTLPSAIVHCSREFVSGLTYVATSRVKNEKDLQILNFSPEHLLQPLQEALTVCHNTIPELPDLSCCSDQQLREEHFIVSDRNGEELADNDDVYLHGYDTLAMESYADGNICSFFEREDDNVVIDLETVLVMLDVGEAQFSSPAEYVDLRQLASGMEMPNPRSEFALENNKNIAIVLERMELFDCFVKIQWLRIYDLFIYHLKENINELYMSRKDLTDATHYLYTKIIGSANLRQESQLLFDVQELTESHHSMVSTICMELFEKFIHAVADAIDREHNTADIIFNVSEMHAEGLAKLRHVGAWAFRKELERSRRYLRNNMFSMNTDTRNNLKAAHAKCELLEERAIVQYSWLKDNTQFPETLEVTENRQYRERGLLHISDCAYNFILRLESLRVELVNNHRLKQSSNKDSFVDDAILSLHDNEELRSLWSVVFEGSDADQEKLISELFKNIITRYMRMGTCQFLKDFRRAYNIKKTSEHRKRVLQRQQVADEKRDAIMFDKIEKDGSPGKSLSHSQLIVYIEKHGASGIKRVYNKNQLLLLCRAYGDDHAKDSFKKQRLVDVLIEKVTTCSTGNMPFHLILNVQFDKIDEDESPGKSLSHSHLIVCIEKHGASGIKKVYNKKQLLLLCRAYGGDHVNNSFTKQRLVDVLIEKVTTCSTADMPFHSLLNAQP